VQHADDRKGDRGRDAVDDALLEASAPSGPSKNCAMAGLPSQPSPSDASVMPT